MISNTPLDWYTLVLEAGSSNGLQQVRAVATNYSTKLTAEAQLNRAQTRALAAHVFGGEQSHVDLLLEKVEGGQIVELLATSKAPCLFAATELVQFGFDTRFLQAAQRCAS
jgi:hypothetical protein